MIISLIRKLMSTFNNTTVNEAVPMRYLPLLWPVRQLRAAAKPNDVILMNLMTSHCFNSIP